MNRLKILFLANLILLIAIETVVTGTVIVSRQVVLRLDPAGAVRIARPFVEEPPSAHRLTVMEERWVLGAPPRQRNPELSPTQLVVVASDPQGQEIVRIIVPDPRLVRLEATGPAGEITSKILYRPRTRLTIALPADPSISQVKIYHPRWTGIEFILDLLGETELPRIHGSGR